MGYTEIYWKQKNDKINGNRILVALPYIARKIVKKFWISCLASLFSISHALNVRTYDRGRCKIFCKELQTNGEI